MSLLPSLGRNEPKEADSSVTRRKKRTLQIHLPNIIHCSYGDETTPTSSESKVKSPPVAQKRPRTTTLQSVPARHICMDFTEAVRLESFPLKPCVHCGLQFGASSVVLHQQNCRQQSSREKSERSKKSRRLRSRRDDTHRECDTVERAVERGDETGSHMVSLSLNPSKEAAANLKPFGSPCRFCGERFGRHSLHLHEKRCQDQYLSSTYKSTGSRSKRK